MTEVLIVVDHVDGAVTKPTLELLTIARRLGEPSAVFFGGEVEAAKGKLAEFGAEKIYAYDDSSFGQFLSVPKSEALAALIGETSPAAVLLVSGGEGKEIAARVSINQ